MKETKNKRGHVWAKTERDAFGEWTLRTQTGAIVAIVGAVVILLSHYPYVLNAVAAVLGILGIYELLHALNQCTTPKMFILSLTALLICFGTIPYYPIMIEIPIWEKSNLTLEEAAAYSGIGINKLRKLSDSESCPFVLWIGSKRLIKRRKLDEYTDRMYSL